MRSVFGIFTILVIFALTITAYPLDEVVTATQDIGQFGYVKDNYNHHNVDPIKDSDIENNYDIDAIHGGDDGVNEVAVDQHARQKRATCDLLSGFGLNHSACATHCLLRGKRGGWCDSRQVCNCRK